MSDTWESPARALPFPLHRRLVQLLHHHLRQLRQVRQLLHIIQVWRVWRLLSCPRIRTRGMVLYRPGLLARRPWRAVNRAHTAPGAQLALTAREGIIAKAASRRSLARWIRTTSLRGSRTRLCAANAHYILAQKRRLPACSIVLALSATMPPVHSSTIWATERRVKKAAVNDAQWAPTAMKAVPRSSSSLLRQGSGDGAATLLTSSDVPTTGRAPNRAAKADSASPARTDSVVRTACSARRAIETTTSTARQRQHASPAARHRCGLHSPSPSFASAW